MAINAKDTYTGGEISIYPNTTQNDCFRFTDKTNNENERLVYSNYWKEQLNLYGQKALYFTNSTHLTSVDPLYGEDPTKGYNTAKVITIGINLNENALLLSKYGLLAEDEVSGFIHIQTFYDVFGAGAEPKSDDVFQLHEYGSDRPGGRNGRMYIITERLDQDIAQINPLAGHYVWLIKAKRYEHSFEPGLSGEALNKQVFEDKKPVSVDGADKGYDYDITEAGKKVFDYTKNDYSDIYGGYQ